MPEQKIKVAHIITSLGYGGAERVLLDLARYIDHKKYDLRVITVVAGGPLEEKFKKIPVTLYINRKKTRLGFLVWWSIYKKLKLIRPQIVHTHLWAGDFWGGLAAMAAGVPVIISTGHNIELDEGRIKRKIRQILAHRLTKVVTVSNAVKDYKMWAEKIPAGKVQVIYNGVKVEKFFNPEPRIFEGPQVKMVIVGRLADQKGHRVLFEAFTRMRYREPILKVVGEGPLRSQLEAMVKRLKLGRRVEFVGVRTDMSQYLRRFDLMVLPSLWEGLGLVLIEASLAGLAVVGSNVGGIPEVILDKETGLIVPPNDPQALAEALDWLIEHPEQARQMGRKAQEYGKRFDLGRMVAGYEQLYESLLEGV